MQTVVAAALLDSHGRLLAARRSSPPELAGRWELPGGKVEPGETDLEALARELREELGVWVQTYARVGGDWPLAPSGSDRRLRVWRARIVEGTARPLQDHDRLLWLAYAQWHSVDWLSGDRPVIEALHSEGDPVW